jgi:hypothetical protein
MREAAVIFRSGSDRGYKGREDCQTTWPDDIPIGVEPIHTRSFSTRRTHVIKASAIKALAIGAPDGARMVQDQDGQAWRMKDNWPKW